jgi:hypothetical protein
MFRELQKKYKKLNYWQQLPFILVASFVIIYSVTWLLAPTSEYMDDVNCGIDTLLKIKCDFRFKP